MLNTYHNSLGTYDPSETIALAFKNKVKIQHCKILINQSCSVSELLEKILEPEIFSTSSEEFFSEDLKEVKKLQRELEKESDAFDDLKDEARRYKIKISRTNLKIKKVESYKKNRMIKYDRKITTMAEKTKVDRIKMKINSK